LFEQNQKLRNVIIKKKARIEEINLILNRPMSKGSSNAGRRRLIEEKLHLEQDIAELQADDRRQAKGSFQWGDLDLRLISPKTNELAREMHKRARDGENKIAFETAKSLNSAGYLPRLFDFHEELVDEWAKRLYAAYCVAWEEQNRVVSPAFIRGIRDRPMAQLFAARESSVKFEVYSRANRMGESVNQVAVAEWEHKMNRLANRWRSNLEAEAVACEYRAAREREFDPAPRNTNLPQPSGEHQRHNSFSEPLRHLIFTKSVSRKTGRVRDWPTIL
jgi:hypothetical protein